MFFSLCRLLHNIHFIELKPIKHFIGIINSLLSRYEYKCFFLCFIKSLNLLIENKFDLIEISSQVFPPLYIKTFGGKI